MRIGELAALAGVSTRTVRHYHHMGLLPEPVRLANGYRSYGLRHAVVLARVRRLAELGLSLDEIRDVLADDRGRDLREVLGELDADLAREQEELAGRRARLAELLAQTDLHPDAAVSPGMAELLGRLRSPGSRSADLDRDLLALMDSAAGPAERDRIVELMRPLTEPGALAAGHALWARLDELAGAGPADPRVAALAADLAEHIPRELAAVILSRLPAGPQEQPGGDEWLAAVSGELSPAQAEVVRLAVAVLRDRA
ncbi:MerR family transcriptional regulator [Microbispora sp. RL4-1S]|uniref:MerR family transcriptional regulator n=1 Tax=Microbispora oryzae TaxID=2806554 RepID=A0A941AIY6_9ACTN|nr:MerR family transcriptional regulator [Microbispora oryzae]MBP2703633.1 MerR family transcriptional regulator [Microbispora oryzae]